LVKSRAPYLCLVATLGIAAQSVWGADVSTAAASVATGAGAGAMRGGEGVPFWVWPVVLFVVSFLLGIIAVLGGVGGGVLYVPLVGGFFPFHLHFVQCAGLMVALSSSVAAGSGLLRKGLADLRLAMPMALMASTVSIFGALVGLRLDPSVVQTLLGIAILGIAAVMLLAGKSQYPNVKKADRLSSALGIAGVYREDSTGQEVKWNIHHTPVGLCAFVAIGFLAGMFGVGAGWANVPVLNLVLGAPLKLSVATSHFLIATTDSTAAWVYVHSGATLPIIVVPSIVGIMLGSMLGVRLLGRVKPKRVRYVVLAILLFAGVRSLLKGMGIWN
jgi:uncharacterized membrane protein YfcA